MLGGKGIISRHSSTTTPGGFHLKSSTEQSARNSNSKLMNSFGAQGAGFNSSFASGCGSSKAGSAKKKLFYGG